MQGIQTLQKIFAGGSSPRGSYSVCCSHPDILKAAMDFSREKSYPLVIESTSNQVDQYGGYTGMKPLDFWQYVRQLAAEMQFPLERLVLGGDHLGPNTWQHQTGEVAMQKAEILVGDYVRAGYRKIHLDASMACAGDSCNEHGGLSDELVAGRAAQLCRTAESVWQEVGGEAPIYVIGTEVPVPGGQQAEEEMVSPTRPEDARQSYQITKEIFARQGLEPSWPRVVAMVVQPGVEFGDESVAHYQRHKAETLSRLAVELNLVFEAHSTDYQPQLRHLVEDHYAILKVGPWLSYAYREALFALSSVAQELQRYKLLPGSGLNFCEKVQAFLLANPKYWQKYYRGSADEVAYKCLYSLSDRIRYYWPQKEMGSYVAELLAQFHGIKLPYSLLSQYFPQALLRYPAAECSPEKLIHSHIQEVLNRYEEACR